MRTTQVDIDSVEKFEALRAQEQAYFIDMVKKCKDAGATLVVCQWGFDDEANHLLVRCWARARARGGTREGG